MIYKFLILSKLEYGLFLFINAKSLNLKMIETVHNTGLKLVSGAFRSSPISSLLNITQTPPICLLKKRMLCYYPLGGLKPTSLPIKVSEPSFRTPILTFLELSDMNILLPYRGSWISI